MIELRFRGVDAVDVCDVHAMQFAQRRAFIGKSWSESETRYTLDADASCIRMSHGELGMHRSWYVNACKAGELHCADKATADVLGLPFSAPAPLSISAPKLAAPPAKEG